jgi:phosphatidylserine decarboxylase
MMTVARWGLPVLGWTLLLITVVAAVVPAGTARYAVVGGGLLLLGYVLWFFRNPTRTPQGDAATLSSPAEGVIADLGEVDEPGYLGGRCLRVGIFLSVFDVHVNRSPVAGRIEHAVYTPGGFLDARAADCGTRNESNAIGIAVDPAVAPGVRLLLRQVSGLIARRIICTHGVGDTLQRGELYGMIRFGSRTEIWVPVAAVEQVFVQVGQRVRCGETPILRLRSEKPS